MYNSEMYLTEKQASRRGKPLSPAEMVRLYSRAEKQAPGLLQRAGGLLVAAGQMLKGQARPNEAKPALGAK